MFWSPLAFQMWHLRCYFCKKRSIEQTEMRPFKCDLCNAKFTSKHSLNGHIAAVHEGKSHSNVTLVRLNLHKNLIWTHILPQFMRKWSHSNVTLVRLNLRKNLIWTHILLQFVKEESASNVTLVMLNLHKNLNWTHMLLQFMKKWSHMWSM